MTDLRSRIRAGETLIGVFSDLASPLAAELCGRAGFDWIVLDLEHGAATEADLLALLYAVGNTPMAPIVRAQSAERLRVGPSPGPWGRRDHAAAASIGERRSGRRSRTCVTRRPASAASRCGPVARTWARSPTVTWHASSTSVSSASSRSSRAARSRRPTRSPRMDEVDVLFVGPADLSHALGVPGRFDDATYLDAVGAVVAACERHGKAAGILIYDAAALPRHLELGFRFIGLGSEGSFVSAGARAMLAAAGRT